MQKHIRKCTKKAIFVAPQRENYRINQKSVRNSKTLLQIIKKESGNSFPEIENMSLKMDSMLVTSPQLRIPTISLILC
jgi:hypothetical protein